MQAKAKAESGIQHENIPGFAIFLMRVSDGTGSTDGSATQPPLSSEAQQLSLTDAAAEERAGERDMACISTLLESETGPVRLFGVLHMVDCNSSSHPAHREPCLLMTQFNLPANPMVHKLMLLTIPTHPHDLHPANSPYLEYPARLLPACLSPL